MDYANKNGVYEFSNFNEGIPWWQFLIFNDYLGTKECPEKIVKEYHITALIMESAGYKVEEYDKKTRLGYIIDNYLSLSGFLCK